MLKNILTSAVVAVVVTVAALLGLHSGSTNSSAFGGTTHFGSVVSAKGGLSVGTTSPTVINNIQAGKCNIRAAANTISASSTVQVDCVSGLNSALAGVLAGDTVVVSSSTSTPSTNEGLTILGASASTTPGYITLKMFNGTGNTYTWTAAASSSYSYIDLR
jgi:hypothetical protein